AEGRVVGGGGSTTRRTLDSRTFDHAAGSRGPVWLVSRPEAAALPVKPGHRSRWWAFCHHVRMSEFRPSRHRRRIVLADWRDAEELAVWHMRRSGFPDATVTGPGADKGIDVADPRRRAVAQVKHLGSPVGAPDVQRLVGAGHMASEYQLFYSLSGYTRQAVEYAHGVGVSLFTYSIYGDVTPA